MSLKYANSVYSGSDAAPTFDIELRKSELENEIEILRAQAKEHLVSKNKEGKHSLYVITINSRIKMCKTETRSTR